MLVCGSPRRPARCSIRPAARSRRWSVGRRTAAAVLLECHRISGRHNLFHRVDERVHLRSTSSAPIFEARDRGSVFRRDPDGTVLTVVAGLYFANGITPTADGSALVFAETRPAGCRSTGSTGDKAGTVTPLAVNLPGSPDNLSTGADGRIWCAMVSPTNAAAEWLAEDPARWCASCCGACLIGCSPRSKPVVWAVAFDPDTGDAVAGLRTEHPSVRHGDGSGGSRKASCGWGVSARPAVAWVELSALGEVTRPCRLIAGPARHRNRRFEASYSHLSCRIVRFRRKSSTPRTQSSHI